MNARLKRHKEHFIYRLDTVVGVHLRGMQTVKDGAEGKIQTKLFIDFSASLKTKSERNNQNRQVIIGKSVEKKTVKK